MPASGVPFTGKGGTVVISNATGATITYNHSFEVEMYSFENTAEVVKGSRLSGVPFKEAGDTDYKGEFTFYAAKSTAGTTLPFTAGDMATLSGTFGGNTVSGQILITTVNAPEIARNGHVKLKVGWEQNDTAFAIAVKACTL